MNARPLYLFFWLLLGTFSALAAPIVADSTRVVLHNGKQHFAHKVLPKETLYSLSRKYNVPVPQIVEANPEVQTALKTGQTVFIPVPPKQALAAKNTAVAKKIVPAATKPAAAARVFTADEKGVKWHTVAAGQTMFSVAGLYALTVDELKKMNNLPDNEIQVGQKLMVGKQAPGKPAKLAQYVPEKDDDLEANAAKTVSVPKVTTPVSLAPPVAEAPAASPDREEIAKPEAEKAAEPAGKRISQSGLAAVINTPFQSAKFLALHKTAPVGTMLQVKNSMNGRSVFVRVIGQLPDTGENDKVVVKISKKAYQSLGALDARFYAEISYIQ